MPEILTGVDCRDYSTSVFFYLHCLPIHSWAQLEVLILMFKAWYGLQPAYLKDPLLPYELALYSTAVIWCTGWNQPIQRGGPVCGWGSKWTFLICLAAMYLNSCGAGKQDECWGRLEEKTFLPCHLFSTHEEKVVTRGPWRSWKQPLQQAISLALLLLREM